MGPNSSRTRNICIIAHIDHGKSTLADRLIQKCGLVTDREFRDQILDTIDIERERGITIKSNTVTLPYKARDGETYLINLIDTPGHADFSYEVSRVLASCEGAVLLIDAGQGVQAQTVANLLKAMEHDLEVIPVINKIDLATANVEATKEQIEEELGLLSRDAILCSAKTGAGVDEVLEAVVKRIPAPTGDPNAPLNALVFGAIYTPFRGVLVSFRIMEGTLRTGDTIRFMSNDSVYNVVEIGRSQIKLVPCESMSIGDVGYLVAGIRTLADVHVGDTMTHDAVPTLKRQPGFEPVKPMVFSSIYPMSASDYDDLAVAIERYALNDAALIYQKDSSVGLGLGFRCGFLGALHLDVVQQRIEEEHGISLVLTAPSVVYHVLMTDGEIVAVDNPSYFPDPVKIECVEEPYVRVSIITPDQFMGPVMTLCMNARAVNPHTEYIGRNRLQVQADVPLAEVIYHFYENLKANTQGYGSLDYTVLDYRASDIVKVDILVNGEKLDALSQLVHQSKARECALHACERLEETIPRQNFKIALQGAIGGNIIARRTLNALRKDVTAKCYGGDITRKRKLLEKQKAGKRRMKMVGRVSVPQEAFVAVLKAPGN
jgi:GTP-binding protein LepA